ncbi:hypothetical protein DYU11_18575 [Fibrisoma montanum]|uniref:Uncharacterized protein n=1 Tax=Fibrisoma montanum TaxID=2305895 RepID=A0A418M6B8_9BACT|nr:hypothetical protein [Fibrisoma montanum]RIV21412.1 hypothetical protein DYU11_18575 [Fibrisoma montanum]
MMNDKKPIRIEELAREHPLRQQPFSVPEGYFDALPSRVQARVTRKKPGFSISWSWQRTAATLAGASLIAVLVWQTLPQRQESLGADTLEGVSDSAIASYLEEQGVNPYELAEQQDIQSSFGTDSTIIQYLDVNPADIQRYMDEEGYSGTSGSEPVNS